MDDMRYEEKRIEIAQAIRTLAKARLLTLSLGHVSWRDPGSGRILILGHTHRAGKFLETVGRDDIIAIDSEGVVLEGAYDPPGEVYLHTEIYKARPDVNSVVHAHPDGCIACSLAGKAMYPVYYRAAQLFPFVPVLDYSGQIDTPAKGRTCAELLGGGCAMLLRGHGCITVGETVPDAAVNTFVLEKNAELLLAASVLGSIEPIRAEDLKNHKPTSIWSYYVHTYDGDGS